MNAVLGRDDEQYCFVCEEPLYINEEHLSFITKVSNLGCSKCGRMYELEFPISGDGKKQSQINR
jgi:hypothetical protein